MTFELFYTGILQGLVLAIISLGLMIPFRLLNFADLTAEGAYPLGGAVYATLIMAGFYQPLATVLAIFSSGLLGVCTAQLALRLNIHSLLAGIIISTMTYSINLRLMKKPNIALFNTSDIDVNVTMLLAIITLVTITILLFLSTDFGLQFLTIGKNQKFAQNHKISINKYTSFGLFLAGSMFGLAGVLTVQMQKFMDIGMGVGVVIHGLAGLMVGEAILGTQTLNKQITAPILGAVIYQQIQGLTLSFGLPPSDLKFFTAGTVLIILALQKKE